MKQVHFRLPTEVQITSGLFWDIMQRLMVVPYLRFGETYRSIFEGKGILTLEDGPDRLSRNVGMKLSFYAA
jgi:uncharacterized protein YerC